MANRARPDLWIPHSEERWLLVTDLDDTLLASDKPEDPLFATFANTVKSADELMVVVNSSRPRGSVLRTLAGNRSVQESGFMPDGLITAMGTEVLIFDDEEESIAVISDREWQKRFDGWDRREVVNTMKAFKSRGVRSHADEFQARFKVSYSVPPEVQDECAEAIQRLSQASRIVRSGESDFDILPATAGKGSATLFVADILGIDIPNRLMVAGDSANDVAMFEVSRHGIVVGNARSELVRRVDKEVAFHSRLPRSRGLLDGLQHWGAILDTVNS
ncbi:MAG: HAD-IIB family hydrolase [Rhodothermales bacterium]